MKKIEVVAAIIINNNRLFATQRGYGNYKDFWEFPGGKIENNETHEAALIREIQEELATIVEPKKLLITVEHDYPEFHLRMHCFLCEIKEGNLTLLEHEDSKWLSLEELNTIQWLPADKEILDIIKSEKLIS